MFAVPGWSLSADKLKAETATSPPAAAAAPVAQSKKRKRAKAPPAPDVTRENVAQLWEQMIEHKDAPKPVVPAKQTDRKRQKVSKPDRSSAAGPTASSPPPPPHQEPNDTDPGDIQHKAAKPDKAKKNKNKKKKPRDRDGQQHDADAEAAEPTTALVADAKPPPPPSQPKLTPLQASMRAKLISARFRHLNETLYTRPSEEAFKLFDDSPEMFAEYHEGFRQQVNVWPENPVDGFISDIRTRGAVRPPAQFGSSKRPQRHQQPARAALGGVEPLPRTAGTCTIADLGCGDGRLGAELQPLSERLRLQVLSFDLHSPAPHVSKADMANVPLPDGTVNVAIFCLALMGTNWPVFVEEAYRLLHWKGELWVAEIKSRFAPPSARKGKDGAVVVDHSVGNRRKKAANKAADELDAARQAEALSVEVDGTDDRRAETDVSAFVQVLKRRGFVLYGDGNQGIDMGNRMFVKMRFIKAAQPTVGKGVPKSTKPMMITGLTKKRVADVVEAPTMSDEAKVLKPCVYKIR